MTDSKVLCIYHDNCADGLGAAWAVYRALGDNVEFVAGRYGESYHILYDGDVPICRDRDVLIVDFSYPLATLREMAKEARSVLVLDHHKTAQEDLAVVPRPDRSYYNLRRDMLDQVRPNPAAVFDVGRSGAGITWDYLVGQSRSPIINLIEDRDLWRFKLPDSRAFNAVLTSYDMSDLPAMFELLDDWHYDVAATSGAMGTFSMALAEGRAILRSQLRAIQSAVEGSRRTMRIAGYVVPAANVPGAMASEAGHLLCQERAFRDFEQWPLVEVLPNPAHDDDQLVHPIFSATYYDGSDGRRHFSLRSAPDGTDVGEIARRYGGGGHAHAAGFDAPIGWEGDE